MSGPRVSERVGGRIALGTRRKRNFKRSRVSERRREGSVFLYGCQERLNSSSRKRYSS